MIRTLIAAALVAVGASAFVAPAQAEDFPAAPLNHGAPNNLPGEHLIPGADIALGVVNGVTQPILQPILAPDAVAASAPVGHARRHWRHASRSSHHAWHARQAAWHGRKAAWHAKQASLHRQSRHKAS